MIKIKLPFTGLSIKTKADNKKGYIYTKRKIFFGIVAFGKFLARAEMKNPETIAVCVFTPKGESKLYLTRDDSGNVLEGI